MSFEIIPPNQLRINDKTMSFPETFEIDKVLEKDGFYYVLLSIPNEHPEVNVNVLKMNKDFEIVWKIEDFINHIIKFVRINQEKRKHEKGFKASTVEEIYNLVPYRAYTNILFDKDRLIGGVGIGYDVCIDQETGKTENITKGRPW